MHASMQPPATMLPTEEAKDRRREYIALLRAEAAPNEGGHGDANEEAEDEEGEDGGDDDDDDDEGNAGLPRSSTV